MTITQNVAPQLHQLFHMKLKCATAYPCDVIHVCRGVSYTRPIWRPLPNHMLCMFSNREDKEPLAQGLRNQVMRFLLHDLGILRETFCPEKHL